MSPCFDHIQKFSFPVVRLKYPALDRFHTDWYDSKAFTTFVFLDQWDVGEIFSSSVDFPGLFSGVLESLWREDRMYWQCISLCLCLPWVLHLLYSSLHVLTPFFTLAFGKLSELSCAILSSLFSQAACVVLTLLSCKAFFLLFVFGVFFLSFAIPHVWFFCCCCFSAFIFKSCTEGKMLVLGKCKQTLHV